MPATAGLGPDAGPGADLHCRALIRELDIPFAGESVAVQILAQEPFLPFVRPGTIRSKSLRGRRGCRFDKVACRMCGRTPPQLVAVIGAVHTNLLYVVTDTTGRSRRDGPSGSLARMS